MNIKKANCLRGEITIPGDKSISHRAVMFGSISRGNTHITNFLTGADCLATIDCFHKMGIQIRQDGSSVTVHGKGMYGLTAPASTLNVGNSGTTTRLISGILAGQSFESVLSGDDSLNSRPMNRIINPLSQMGAAIVSMADNCCAPLRISPSTLTGIHYQSAIASAQVKSAILLAGLYAQGTTSVTEPVLSRNHTELMLKSFGAQVEIREATITIKPCNELSAQEIHVPGDISSAAYFIAAALIVPNSEILIRNVGINPTRAGIIHVCKAMGGNITLLNETINAGEATADLLVKTSTLKGITVEGGLIPTLIDEIPIIAVLAAFASGRTTIKDAAELKVKETDRILTVTENLFSMGCHIVATDDGMIIDGGSTLHGAAVESHLDHRIAMAFSIAGLGADGITSIQNSDCVDVSYPSFYETIGSLTQF